MGLLSSIAKVGRTVSKATDNLPTDKLIPKRTVPSLDKDKVNPQVLPPAENSSRTQIAGTLPTYKKADTLLTDLAGKGKTLDFGAGLGLSKKELNFDTYEPFPKANFTPDFNVSSDIPSNSYKKITNLNVLNVVPRDVRNTIVQDIGRILEPNGIAIITTRGRDVMTAKGASGPEPMSIITTNNTYQKGFTQSELNSYVTEILGDGFKVTNNKLGAAGVTIQKLSLNNYSEGGSVKKKPIDTGEKTVTGRTIWRDPTTGQDYSERSTTFEIDGKYYTMPTVSEDGTQYTDRQIMDYVKEYGPSDYLTGEELPEFRYREDAIQYAISRSDTRKQKEEPMLQKQMLQFNEGGLSQEGGMVDEVSGNEVPMGSTREEVRDDIPAQVSEGEFIFPADVVRFIGLNQLMQIRQDAKMGLKKMDAMGQMGNSDEATMPDDMPFGMADLVVIDGPDEEVPSGMHKMPDGSLMEDSEMPQKKPRVV